MFATIPRTLSSTQERSPVYAVCNAIACAYLASTTGMTAALVNRPRAYGTVLMAVNAALDDPVQYKNDSTWLAIWMFLVYVVRFIQGDRHCRGVASLIKLRDSGRFSR
jgi:hypothetical protein